MNKKRLSLIVGLIIGSTCVSGSVLAQTLPANVQRMNAANANANGININSRWSDAPKFVENQATAPAETPQLPQQLIAPQPGQQIDPSMSTPQSQQLQTVEVEKPPVEDTETQKILWSIDTRQELRQSGGRFELPNARGFASSSNMSDQLRLKEWRRHLLNVGLPKEKIDFEARRLNREDFELWASRFVWWDKDLHPNAITVD